jgi:putative PIG3 family NAD(P)H quinone oxidoreductase
VTLRSHGGLEVLTVEDLPDPTPGPEEVLVDIAATAINRADILQRMGLYPGPKMAVEIAGMELSGTVASLGERAGLWRLGDRVMGIVGGGAYAERICVHERQLMAVPASVDLVDGAAIPEVFLTAWDALVVQGGLTSGRWALVHAGASGVGTAAIQVVKAIGARIAVTCSSGKMDACRALGADLVFERSPHDWLADARATVPTGFDVVLDVIAGDEVNRNIEAVALRGRIMLVGAMGSGRAEVDVGRLLPKRAAMIGTVLRARPLEEKIALTRRFAAEMLPLFDDGRLRPVVHCRLPLEQIAEAHRLIETNATTGKVVVTM